MKSLSATLMWLTFGITTSRTFARCTTCKERTDMNWHEERDKEFEKFCKEVELRIKAYERIGILRDNVEIARKNLEKRPSRETGANYGEALEQLELALKILNNDFKGNQKSEDEIFWFKK